MARRYLKYFNRTLDGTLQTPYARTVTHGTDASGKRVTLDVNNAVGFEAAPVKGRLILCEKGYHLYKSKDDRLSDVKHADPNVEAWYWVEPVGPVEISAYNKVVVRSYRILGVPKPWEWRRSSKDQRRSHKKRIAPTTPMPAPFVPYFP